MKGTPLSVAFLLALLGLATCQILRDVIARFPYRSDGDLPVVIRMVSEYTEPSASSWVSVGEELARQLPELSTLDCRAIAIDRITENYPAIVDLANVEVSGSVDEVTPRVSSPPIVLEELPNGQVLWIVSEKLVFEFRQSRSP